MIACWIWSAIACSDPPDPDTGSIDSTSPPTATGATTLSGDLILTDEDNYTYAGVVEAASEPVAAQTDIAVDWGALTIDMLGREIADPAGIGQLALVEFDYAPSDLLTAIAANEMSQSDILDYRLVSAEGRTAADLSELSVLGNAFDPATELVPTDGTWALSLMDLFGARMDFRSLMLLDLSGAATSVAFTDETATVLIDVDLDDRGPQTSAGLSYTADWSAMTVDVFGHDLDDRLADRLLIGHLPTSVLAEVEARFVQIRQDADALYELEVYGDTKADLANAVSTDGTAFPGFTARGTWLLGLECSTCTGPVPLVMTVVTVL